MRSSQLDFQKNLNLRNSNEFNYVIIDIFSFLAINPSLFLSIGSKYTKTNWRESNYTRLRRFKSSFGVTPQVCFITWQNIKDEVPSYAHPKHLLWCLNFLKEYSVEHTRKAIFDADEKTVRKWTWIFVELLSKMNVVRFLF